MMGMMYMLCMLRMHDVHDVLVVPADLVCMVRLRT